MLKALFRYRENWKFIIGQRLGSPDIDFLFKKSGEKVYFGRFFSSLLYVCFILSFSFYMIVIAFCCFSFIDILEKVDVVIFKGGNLIHLMPWKLVF